MELERECMRTEYMETREGTSIEIIEFLLNNNYYGMNIKFVKGNTPYQQIAVEPNAPPGIMGVFHVVG